MDLGGGRGRTYVAEVLHDIVEFWRLLELIPLLLDRFLGHQVPCDLRPHTVSA